MQFKSSKKFQESTRAPSLLYGRACQDRQASHPRARGFPEADELLALLGALALLHSKIRLAPPAPRPVRQEITAIQPLELLGSIMISYDLIMILLRFY